MWYKYDLTLLSENKMKVFSEELEKTFSNLFNNDLDNSNPNLPEYKKFIHINLRNNLHHSCGFFYDFKNFYDEYQKLNNEQKYYLKRAFENNIKIESISKNEIKAISYSDIKAVTNDEIFIKLKKIFDDLYKNLKECESFEINYISPLKYYQNLRKLNIIKQICPFCGYSQTSMSEENFREDYDHYLPKSKYPFISLHYRNLIPMCEKCNSDYKGNKDFNNKFFYPFSNDIWENKLNILDIKNISVTESLVEIEIINNSPCGKIDEIESWDLIFQVKNRSKSKIKDCKAKILGSFMSLYIKKKSINKILNFKEWIEDRLCECEADKFSELNIFKISLYEFYLKNCNEIESIKGSIFSTNEEINDSYKYK